MSVSLKVENECEKRNRVQGIGFALRAVFIVTSLLFVRVPKCREIYAVGLTSIVASRAGMSVEEERDVLERELVDNVRRIRKYRAMEEREI